MKKSVVFCMALLTIVLLSFSYVPTLFLENGDRLFWQLSNWAWIFASMLIPIIGVVLVMACLISIYIAMVRHDEKIWSNKDYVVYSEYDGFIDPNKFVLYKRDGLIERRMYSLGNIGFGDLKGADYSMYVDLDLIKEEIDATEFESDSVYHRTRFYRLSDGWPFEQEENDSLMNMFKH